MTHFEQPSEPAKEYRCLICGYFYEPSKGDASQGVLPGTAFDELPDTWVCPSCRAGKRYFVAVDE